MSEKPDWCSGKTGFEPDAIGALNSFADRYSRSSKDCLLQTGVRDIFLHHVVE